MVIGGQCSIALFVLEIFTSSNSQKLQNRGRDILISVSDYTENCGRSLPEYSAPNFDDYSSGTYTITEYDDYGDYKWREVSYYSEIAYLTFGVRDQMVIKFPCLTKNV